MTKILIADKDEFTCRLIENTLTDNGYVCNCANSAAKARQIQEEEVCELMIIGQDLPDESGLELARYILNNFQHMAILLLIEEEELEIMQEAIQAGVYDYLLRPLNKQAALIEIHNALHRRKLEIKYNEYLNELEKSINEKTEVLEDTVKRLQESEERYRTLVENSNDGVAISDADVFYYVNQKTIQLLGCSSKEDIIGQKIEHFIHPEDRSEIKQKAYERINKDKPPERYVFRALRKDGYTIFLEASSVRTTYQGMHVSLAYLRDVSEQIEAERFLRHSHGELEQLLSSIPAVLIQLDIREQVIRWNGQAEEVLAMDNSEVIGKKIEDLEIDWEREKVKQSLERCRRDGKPVRLEGLSFRDLNGRVGILDCRINPFYEQGKGLKGFIILGTEMEA